MTKRIISRNVLRNIASVVALLIVCFLGLSEHGYAEPDPNGVIIKDVSSRFNLGASTVVPLDTAYVESSLYNYLDSCGADSIRKIFPTFDRSDTLFTRPDGVVVRLYDLSLYYKVFFTDSVDYASFASGLQGVDSISSCLKDERMNIVLDSPNDPLFGEQTYLQAEGPSNGGAINAVAAWNTTVGDSSQIIGFIDDGIDGDHPDIDDKIAGGTSVEGVSEYFYDPGGHGTAVAGILAAETDNNIGIAGINWSAKLFVSKVNFGGFNFDFFSAFGPQLQAVVDFGASQINMSFGSGDVYGTVLEQAFVNAWRMDVSLVAAKGNNGNTDFHYPSDYDYIIGVGALEKNRLRRDDSNYGNGIKLVAQGRDVKTLEDGGGYRTFQRTSSAAPQITGAISLVRAANPWLTADEAEEILYLTAIDNELHGAGYDSETGYGTPDVGAAVAYATERVFIRPDHTYDSFTKMWDGVSWALIWDTALVPSIYYDVDVWVADKYIDFSQYGFTSIPDIITRMRSASGFAGAEPNPGKTFIVIDSSTLTTTGVSVKTFAFYVGMDFANNRIDRWYPSDLADHSAPAIRLAMTVAGEAGLSPPTYLYTENFSNDQQRIRLSWDDLNFFDSGWVVERKPSELSIWETIDSLPGNATATIIYEDTSAAGSQAYDYRVKPYGLANSPSSYSPIATITTPPRWPDNAIPVVTQTTESCGFGAQGAVVGGGFESQALGGGGLPGPPPLFTKTDQIIVYWSPPANQSVAIDHYKLQRLDQTQPTEQGPVFDNIYATSYTLCDNLNDTSYPFRIWAYDINGNVSLGFKTVAAVTGCYDICAQEPSQRVASADNIILPSSTELIGNHPNPFNPSTTISYSLAKSSPVSLIIYNILGQHVQTLIDEQQEPGVRQVFWDGRDESGAQVSSGVYFYRLTTLELTQSKKMLFLK